MVEHAPQIDREGFVRLLVEGELVHVAELVPAGIVVVPGGLMEAQLHVVVRRDPFGGVDDAPFEGGIDLGGGDQDRRSTALAMTLPPRPVPMRIFSPLKSPIALIFFRNHPPSAEPPPETAGAPG